MTPVFRTYLIIFLISLFLTGCGTSSKSPFPTRQPAPEIDISKIPNAIPRNEPRSRYGNPSSYEVFGQRYYTMKSAKGFVEKGIASWYGPNFHGKKTSSQEVYDMNKMTAAHKTIPIPSYVEVTNLKNGKKIVVRINDRGPFHDGRIIDLSYVGAKKLGIVDAGTGVVEIRVIDPSNPQAHHQVSAVPKSEVRQNRQKKTIEADQKQLFIQLGAFSELENAQQFRSRIQQTLNESTRHGGKSRIVSIATIPSQDGALYKVRIGPVANIEMADQIVLDLNDAGLYDHHVLFQ